MPPVGFEPTISVGERPQTYALDRAATGTSVIIIIIIIIIIIMEVTFPPRTGQKDQRGSRVITIPFFNLGARSGWVVNNTRLSRFTP